MTVSIFDTHFSFIADENRSVALLALYSASTVKHNKDDLPVDLPYLPRIYSLSTLDGGSGGGGEVPARFRAGTPIPVRPERHTFIPEPFTRTQHIWLTTTMDFPFWK